MSVSGVMLYRACVIHMQSFWSLLSLIHLQLVFDSLVEVVHFSETSSGSPPKQFSNASSAGMDSTSW